MLQILTNIPMNAQLFIYSITPLSILLMEGNPNDVILISIYGISIVCLQKTELYFSETLRPYMLTQWWANYSLRAKSVPPSQ
jgi:hypothetical protein